MNQQFLDIVRSQVKDSSSTNKSFIEAKSREIEKVKLENEKLLNLVATKTEAKGIDAILNRMSKNEELLQKLENEKNRMMEENLVALGQKVDPDFVISGIKKLREDGFRKAKITKKRAIIQEVVKSIHVNPDNVIRIDFWANENQSEAARDASRKAGVVLPFRKLGEPLEASFRLNAARGDKFSEIKKAAGLGAYVLSQSGQNFSCKGKVWSSSSVGNGCGSRI